MLPGVTGTMTGAASAASGSDLLSIIQSLSLTTNLQLCLDAGDSASYSGSGQTWNDRSGGGYNFYLGADGSAGGTDPTFNGTPGALNSSNYWSYNGSQYFTLAQSNPTWVNNLHKAGATFTIVMWAYANGITSTAQPFANFGNNGAASYTGCQVSGSANSLRALNIYVSNNNVPVYTKDSSTTFNNNAWNFLAISVNMATGVVIYNINGTAETYTSQVYSSPSASSASNTMQIGALGGASFPDTSGDRAAELAAWSSSLSSANLSALFTATRTRFGV